MKNIKICLFLFSMILLIGYGCDSLKENNHTIIEDIILNKSTYEDVKNFVNIKAEEYYNVELGIFELSGWYNTKYTINNVSGKLSFGFDKDTGKLICVRFDPSDYSKKSGDDLKTWLFDKYSDYEQTTKDTGFVFSNGSENVELYITENPIDDTQYYSLYIEWTIVE